MSHPFEILLQLQDIDARLDDARRHLADIEAGVPLQRHRRHLDEITARLDALEQQLRETQRRAQRAEAEAANCRTEQERLEKRLYGGEIASVKEMEKMQARIADLGRQADEHEMAALEALEQAQELEQSVASVKKQQDEARAALAERQEQVQAVAIKLADQVRVLEERRPQVAAAIPGDLLQQYDFHRRRGGVVVAPIQGDRCGSCRVILPRALIARATKQQGLELCESCGRLLVWVGD